MILRKAYLSACCGLRGNSIPGGRERDVPSTTLSVYRMCGCIGLRGSLGYSGRGRMGREREGGEDQRTHGEGEEGGGGRKKREGKEGEGGGRKEREGEGKRGKVGKNIVLSL